jgi:hypothetical protein
LLVTKPKISLKAYTKAWLNQLSLLLFERKLKRKINVNNCRTTKECKNQKSNIFLFSNFTNQFRETQTDDVDGGGVTTAECYLWGRPAEGLFALHTIRGGRLHWDLGIHVEREIRPGFYRETIRNGERLDSSRSPGSMSIVLGVYTLTCHFQRKTYQLWTLLIGK